MTVSSSWIKSIWTFRYPGSVELRVEELAAPITREQAKAMCDAIHEQSGSLCAICHNPARVRIIKAEEPAIARCFDCHDQSLTYGEGTTRG